MIGRFSLVVGLDQHILRRRFLGRKKGWAKNWKEKKRTGKDQEAWRVKGDLGSPSRSEVQHQGCRIDGFSAQVGGRRNSLQGRENREMQKDLGLKGG